MVVYRNVGWKMKPLALIAFLFAAVATTAAEMKRPVVIRGWEFMVPSFLAQRVHDGPDFTVTYFSSEQRKMGMGIYEGGFPQEEEKGQKDLRREEEQIAGQNASWALWSQEADGKKSFHFEIYLLVSPGETSSDKFHLFGAAATEADLEFLRNVVRSAQRKEAANPLLEPSAASGHGSP